jgi:putative ABC transport system ATP-binding protein
MAVFQELNGQGKTVVIVTHEEEIAHHCKRIIRFRDGVVRVDEQVAKQIIATEVLAAMVSPEGERVTQP